METTGGRDADGVTVIAADTGGTFTDVIGLRGGELSVLKVPSTPDDPARAVLEGVRRAVPDGEAFVLVHGSTVATNALLERRGARVALVTNRGFEDVLEIGRQRRPQLYALVGDRPPSLVARGDRHGIAGRRGADGAELEPLDPGELSALADDLRGADAVAICLLHSYAEPEHERRVAAALREIGAPLSVSSDLLPEYREYERMATTVVNAYVAPRMDRYLERLEAEAGARRVRVMGSGGGAIPVERARREPVHTVLSGPAGGVVGALNVAEQAGIEGIITFDMGGTSTDVSLCPDRPQHTTEFEIAGLPVAVPVIDIHTVGAGGGSLAWIDAGGALRVGPRSAGADPGPISYGRGGRDVTVTDAHVWLGRLPVDAFLGGERRLDRERIGSSLHDLADRVDMTANEAAEGVLSVANTAMEGALRVISVERGHDPADLTLVPFGGAAALHAIGLAERLGIPRVLIPPTPGVLSAYGMLASPVRKESARTVLLDGTGAAERIREHFEALTGRAVREMGKEGIPRDRITLRRTVDARYRGQSYELRVPADGWVEAFHRRHERRYGYARRDASVEAVTLRVEATAPAPMPPLPSPAAASTDRAPESGSGRVVFRGRPVRTPRYDRTTLRAGHRIGGPAIVTEYSATTWLPPGWEARVDATGSLLAERE